MKSFVLRTAVVSFVFFSRSLLGATNEFTGSSGGFRDEDANWSLERPTTADDDVLIPSGKTVKSTNPVVAASLTISVR